MEAPVVGGDRDPGEIPGAGLEAALEPVERLFGFTRLGEKPRDQAVSLPCWLSRWCLGPAA